MTAEPLETPVTTPVAAPTVAIEVLLLVQTPADAVLLKDIVDPAQTEEDPVIAPGVV